MSGEKTTSEVAALFGISVDLLRKYKKRHLKKSPSGVAGQGRSVQCMWSEEAIDEVRRFLAVPRPRGVSKKSREETNSGEPHEL